MLDGGRCVLCTLYVLDIFFEGSSRLSDVRHFECVTSKFVHSALGLFLCIVDYFLFF
jgi:hypothetical protein